MTSHKTTTKACSCRCGGSSSEARTTAQKLIRMRESKIVAHEAPLFEKGGRKRESRLLYRGARGRFLSSLLAIVVIGIGGAGCASNDRNIFPALKAPISWPDAPQRPRIDYVGELRTSADLKAKPTLGEALGEVFVGKSEPAPLFGPRDVLVTADGERVWVADPGGRCLHMFDLERRKYARITEIGGSPLISPVCVSRGPGGGVLVCDSERASIDLISGESGALFESVQLPEDVLRPVDVLYDASTGEYFVVDSAAHDIKVLSDEGRLLRVLAKRGVGRESLNFPTSIATDGQNLWITDTGNNRAVCMSRAGEELRSIGKAGDAPGDLAMPKSIAVDADGHIYVVDGRFENVQIFDNAGRLLLFFGGEGTAPGQFWLPGGVFIEQCGRIWVCDSYNRRLQVFQYVREVGDE